MTPITQGAEKSTIRHGSLLSELPTAGPGEHFESLATGSGARVERIVSHGHCSPPDFWYDQEEDEWVLLVSGRAALEIEGRAGELELAPGDWLHLPAHRRHRVTWTHPEEPTVWLAVHLRTAPRG